MAFRRGGVAGGWTKKEESAVFGFSGDETEMRGVEREVTKREGAALGGEAVREKSFTGGHLGGGPVLVSPETGEERRWNFLEEK